MSRLELVSCEPWIDCYRDCQGGVFGGTLRHRVALARVVPQGNTACLAGRQRRHNVGLADGYPEGQTHHHWSQPHQLQLPFARQRLTRWVNDLVNPGGEEEPIK